MIVLIICRNINPMVKNIHKRLIQLGAKAIMIPDDEPSPEDKDFWDADIVYYPADILIKNQWKFTSYKKKVTACDFLQKEPEPFQYRASIQEITI